MGLRSIRLRITPLAPLVLVALLVACQPTVPTTPSATPAPTAPAANAAWTPAIQTIDGVEMVYVPAGCFIMGNADGRRDERPPHEVCIINGFWLDRTEVTNTQYGSDGPYVGENRPRTNVTWQEARAHCQTRGARLPTEAEWEYAARGPESWLYPWGNAFNTDYLAYDRNQAEPIDVGSLPAGASWVGALDLSGNVWEWVNTEHRRYPYVADDGRENTDDLTTERVYRSGRASYQDLATSGPVRFRAAADARDWFIGFRCTKSEGA
jgi:formylglycine-generating enzyme required for sulfatase activity